MRAINLLPRDQKSAKGLGTKRTPLLVAVGGVAAVTAAAAVFGFSASGTAGERQTALQDVEAAIARLPRAPAPAISQGVLTQERSNRIAALSSALSSRIAFDRLLRDISLVLPEDAWLTGLSAASSAAAPVAASPATTPGSSTAAQSVTIQGATYSHASVARVLSRLSIVPSLENVTLNASARVQSRPADQTGGSQPAQPPTRSKSVVTFTIAASLRTTGSP